jgi:hypothetical protein
LQCPCTLFRNKHRFFGNPGLANFSFVIPPSFCPFNSHHPLNLPRFFRTLPTLLYSRADLPDLQMMDNVRVDRWATGNSCMCSTLQDTATLNSPVDGPVISQTDLYLLKPNLQIHPILTKSHSFILIFNLLTGAYLLVLKLCRMLNANVG